MLVLGRELKAFFKSLYLNIREHRAEDYELN